MEEKQNNIKPGATDGKYIRILIIGIITILGVIMIYYLINSKPVCNNISSDVSEFNKGLVLYYQFNDNAFYSENNKIVCDMSGNNNIGRIYNARWNSIGGYFGDGAFEFNGINSSIRVKENKILSPNNSNGNFSISFFIQFHNLNFIGEGTGNDYINFLGKGSKKNGYEWIFRLYNSSNTVNRPTRISIYAYNPEGGIGTGAYFQDAIKKNEWIYITGVIEGDKIKIYKNGLLRNTQNLTKNKIFIIDTRSDLFIGTINQKVYFNGSIDELRIYDRSLNDSEVKNLYTYTISTLYPYN